MPSFTSGATFAEMRMQQLVRRANNIALSATLYYSGEKIVSIK